MTLYSPCVHNVVPGRTLIVPDRRITVFGLSGRRKWWGRAVWGWGEGHLGWDRKQTWMYLRDKDPVSIPQTPKGFFSIQAAL